MNLQKISNNDLWKKWTGSMESAALDPSNSYAKRREEQCMDEIIRRMKEASKVSMLRREQKAVASPA